MKRTGIWLATVLLTCLAGNACGGSSQEANSPPVSSAAPAPAAVPAPPAEARDGLDILSVLSVEHEVDVLAQREGTVTDIAKDEGSRVSQGDVLARLDDRALVAQRDRARANLQVARYNVQYNEAEVKAKQAALHRQQLLRESGLSSDADLESAEFQAKGAQYDLESWHAVVARNEAELRELEVEIQQMLIRAPFMGVVSRRYLRVGQTLAKGDKCFRVSQLGPLQVRFQVPESAAHQPRIGETIQVRVSSVGSRLASARIQKVSPTVDPASDSYDVSAQLTGADLKDFRPGMAVHVLWQAAPAPKP